MKENTLIIKKTCKKKTDKKKTIFLFCMLIIPILDWLLFWFYVNISSIALAFKDARTGILTFDNFIIFWEKLTSKNGELGLAITNTFKYFGTSLFIVTPLCLFISYFLYKQVFGYRIYRIMFYLPAIVSGVAMVAVFKNFINPNGPLDLFLRNFDVEIPPEGLLARKETATTVIIIYTIWTGFTGNVLLFCGSMVRVPIECLESAALEGCGPFRELIQIILPLIWPTVSTQVVFMFTGVFSASGPILLFTNGEFGTSTLAFWIWQGVYSGQSSYNIISATGLFFTMIGVPIILIVRWILEKIPTIEY